ncbi:HdeD family acid-resistance protein [Microbacterium sp.]|uniref:HdeD family acid-resistance protein n=1 Tax=Microbacterium sp. TaxID=51671 RepID=UPI003F9C70BF
MTNEPSIRDTATNGIRTALGVSGIFAIIVGVLILVWPGRTAVVVAAIIAIYAILAGLIYASIGIFSKTMRAWGRVGHIILGILFIVAGIIAFMNLTLATGVLAVLLSVLVGVMWIVEGIVALSTLGDSSSRGWSIFFALLSVIAGIVLLFSPLWGAAVLWWLLGISMVVLGIINAVRAFRIGRRA